MKKFLLAATLFAIAVPSMAADVGVSINIGQPGFYGRIDIGQFPQPAVIYAEPVIIQPAPRYIGKPIYLRVPPGHAKKWSKHCGKYNACGQQVYFVQDGWYNNVYAPSYRNKHADRHDKHDGNKHENKHENKHDDNGRHGGHGNNGNNGNNGKHKGRDRD